MDDLDTLRLALTSSLLQVGRHWRQVSHDVVTVYGISAACATPLLFIGRLGEGVRQVVLADYVGIESPSLVRLLDQMSKAGLIRREVDPVDRRANTLWFTEQGRALSDKIEEALITLRAEVLSDISREDLLATLRVFNAIETAAAQSETSSSR
ncbi:MULTISPECIES: MarR family winged helix-turn-helix transcriptional regulator [Silvimonas]|uniref:MarR family winged helix-turn-helix transcriptional regulator n=1 Tax=Silvimonas TaxID=300264 RepID=UPI0024B36EA0|nr:MULTISPECIES: MarR family transcriptional regulator [Silvimonas]MDR3429250.1 MarR family transcriptional regulator [Silvimonas sp.]